MAIARQPNEAVGGIMKLVKGEETMTLNVEYNQIDALLKESGWHANGDVPNSVLNLGTPETAAFSPFPGNTNTLLYSLDEYLVTLTRT